LGPTFKSRGGKEGLGMAGGKGKGRKEKGGEENAREGKEKKRGP